MLNSANEGVCLFSRRLGVYNDYYIIKNFLYTRLPWLLMNRPSVLRALWRKISDRFYKSPCDICMKDLLWWSGSEPRLIIHVQFGARGRLWAHWGFLLNHLHLWHHRVRHNTGQNRKKKPNKQQMRWTAVMPTDQQAEAWAELLPATTHLTR